MVQIEKEKKYSKENITEVTFMYNCELVSNRNDSWLNFHSHAVMNVLICKYGHSINFGSREGCRIFV